MTVVAIHQPNYLPWVGFFGKASIADVFIILDNVQFTKHESTQRTKIRTQNGWMWLTIPVQKQYHFKPICDISLPNDDKWRRKHKTSIVANYSKCPYFDPAFVDAYYGKNFGRLEEFNEYGIDYLLNRFGITPKIVRASELGIDGTLKATERIIALVKAVGGDTYLSGTGGRRYLDEMMIAGSDLKLRYFEFNGMKYPQRWHGFEPYMSGLDLLFNLGVSPQFSTIAKVEDARSL